MRKLAASFAAVALLAACGSSSKGAPSTGTPLSGHVGGRAFTPTQARAVVVGSGASGCTLAGLGVTVGVKAVEIEAATFDPASANSDACADLSAVQCQYHASSQAVRILVAKVNLTGPSEPTLGASTDPYVVSSTLAPPSVYTTGYVAFAEAVGVGPAPAYVSTSETSLDGGHVTLTEVSDAGPVAGNVSISFTGGSSVSGDFSANVCGGTPLDVCALANELAASLGGAPAGLCTLPAANVP